MSTAVNAISKAKGVLFVIAAGNAGPSNKVSAPAAADLSIAVAAIDKSRNLANFSSRGPRLINMALKPDISAPGVSITAARANHGSGDPYATFSGTSMASPMVAGSAALVWQLHPTWTREQVKDALLTSAVPIGSACEVSAFDQGAGAVSLAGILDQSVTADPGTVSFGIVRGSATKELTLQNLTHKPMTVSLSASLCVAGKPDGLLQVTPSQVTIPAGAAAHSQTIVVSASDFKKSGTFTGAISVEDLGALVAREAVGLVVK
jgi:subtilisin family serine protease